MSTLSIELEIQAVSRLYCQLLCKLASVVSSRHFGFFFMICRSEKQELCVEDSEDCNTDEECCSEFCDCSYVIDKIKCFCSE